MARIEDDEEEDDEDEDDEDQDGEVDMEALMEDQGESGKCRRKRLGIMVHE